MTISSYDTAFAGDGVTYAYEIKRGVVLAVLCGGSPSRRWCDATRLHLAELRSVCPESVLFVEFELTSKRFSLLCMRWNPRLWSYCYAGASVLSEAMTTALGLRAPNWQQALANISGRAAQMMCGADPR
jgi:hypothetical protein